MRKCANGCDAPCRAPSALCVSCSLGIGLDPHVHDWKPAEGVTARYRCTRCPAWGRRPSRGGAIVEQPHTPYYARTQPTAGEQPSGLGRGGKAPTLDETEKR